LVFVAASKILVGGDRIIGQGCAGTLARRISGAGGDLARIGSLSGVESACYTARQ